jgi:DNA-binding transcriptional LysR family regulator
MEMVASPLHPLANYTGPIPATVLSRYTQLVLTDRSELSKGQEFGVMSSKTWRLADLGAKHAFLRAGLGWGSMPFNVIAADFVDGSLVSLSLEDAAPQGFTMPMSAVFPTAAAPGPAGRWLIDRLKQGYRTAAL